LLLPLCLRAFPLFRAGLFKNVVILLEILEEYP
jgi:hypothetical protein